VSNIVEKESFDTSASSVQRKLRNQQSLFDLALMTLPAEKVLGETFTKVISVFDTAVKAKKYAEAGQALAGLVDPITGFFTDVLVMDKDEKIKNNRVGLLKGIDQLFKKTANYKKIVL
jgi:glycyl-tRNA synthetase beta chain